MTYIQLCAAMQGGYVITLSSCGKTYNGQVIGIRPESGTRDIHHWLITLVYNSKKTDVYFKE